MENKTYDTITNPTAKIYKLLDDAYAFFNEELFEGKLPGCLITMQRKSKARGYFSPERFESRSDAELKTHEIALNPMHFKDRTDEEIISTLVHEMVHVWQQEFGNPPRRGYHDREWAGRMEMIGLVPSNTGEPDGRRTGQSMSHYINHSGKFSRLVKVFLGKNGSIICQDAPVLAPIRKAKNKMKYTCPRCGINAWGKAGIKILCGSDNVELQMV